MLYVEDTPRCMFYVYDDYNCLKVWLMALFFEKIVFYFEGAILNHPWFYV